DAVSRGLAGAGLDVIQYGLASTPAMFNSTLTVDETLFCPVDGSIMITGISWNTENNFVLKISSCGAKRSRLDSI
ncbi:hypothetical protein GW17_00028973, partial [Ensete ventricosum]